LYGKIAEEELLKMESRYSILIQLQETTGAAGASPRPTLQDIINQKRRCLNLALIAILRQRPFFS
jgi:hypothetical protein